MARERLEKTIAGAGNKKIFPDSEEQEMFALRQKGWTMRAIGAEFALTRQRVQQIMKKYFKKESSEITAPTIRKPRDIGSTRRKAIELTWDDGSVSPEVAITSSIRKYRLCAPLGPMLHNKSTKKIYSRALDAYVISARLM